jgi:hypothetical protein
LFILVGAGVTWLMVGVAVWCRRPDLAQPLAMLGAALVNGLLNHKKDRGKTPGPSACCTP